MSISPTLLLRLLAASFLVGVAMGILYDALRICRVLLGMNRYTEAASAPVFCPSFYKPKSRGRCAHVTAVAKHIFLFAQDFLFCIAVGIAVALLLFSHNSGEFRGFVLIGVGVGFAAYYFTVGRLVIHASEYVVFAVKTLFLYAVYYVTLPFISLGRLVIRYVGGTARKIRAKKREKRIGRHTKNASQSMLRAADVGFLSGSLLADTSK